MEYERFIATVREGAGLSDREAERVACATLQTLSERITPGESRTLAERLPERLRRCSVAEGHPERFDLEELLRRRRAALTGRAWTVRAAA